MASLATAPDATAPDATAPDATAPDRPAERPPSRPGADCRPLAAVPTAVLAGILPLPAAAASALVNRIGCPLLLAREARLGEAAAGAGGGLAERARRGTLLSPEEDALLAALDQLPPFERYHELGNGVAALGMALALSGRPVVSLTPFTARRAAACEIYDGVQDERPDLAARCTLRQPRLATLAEDLPPGGGALALVTNLVLDLPPGQEGALLGRLAGHAAVLLDPQRFLRRRDGAAQAALLVQLAEAGLHPAPLPGPAGGRYRLLLPAPRR